MKANRIVAIAALLLAIAGVSWSVTPAQVGAYAGTLKKTVFFDGGKTVVTAQLLVNVSADESTTFTVDGVQWDTSVAVYNFKDGVAVLGDPGAAPNSSVILAAFTFKRTSLSGTLTELVVTAPGNLFLRSGEGKFKLKKL